MTTQSALAHSVEVAQPAFALEDVGFEVEGRTLLHGVDLELDTGQFYGLIGHNGSGKSTLMTLLARQQLPSRGQIAFCGQPLKAWSQREYARQIGYLAQRLPENTGLTVRELVELGRYPWHGALGRFTARDRAHVEDALRLTDTERFAERMLDTLSGGERQRAWLAMLVAQDSRCLLLDEPISALDIAHQIEVMDLVRRLCHERELTVVAVLHDINIAARFCDQLIALHSGGQVAQGAPAEVVQPPVLERIYGLAMGVLDHPERLVPISYVA